MARHWKSSFRFTPSAWKQHVLQRRHGQLLRDFHLVNLCEIHAQRAGIPRGTDVVQSSVAATALLDQSIALQHPDRHIASAPAFLRSGGRRGRRSQSPWELPSPRLRPSNSKGALPRRPETGSPCPVVRSGPTSVAERCARARKTLPQDRHPGDRSARLPSNKLPEQTWREKARVELRRRESHVCGKAETCHVCHAPCEGACELSRVDR